MLEGEIFHVAYDVSRTSHIDELYVSKGMPLNLLIRCLISQYYSPQFDCDPTPCTGHPAESVELPEG